jgi:hypothetical protein
MLKVGLGDLHFMTHTRKFVSSNIPPDQTRFDLEFTFVLDLLRLLDFVFTFVRMFGCVQKHAVLFAIFCWHPASQEKHVGGCCTVLTWLVGPCGPVISAQGVGGLSPVACPFMIQKTCRRSCQLLLLKKQSMFCHKEVE